MRTWRLIALCVAVAAGCGGAVDSGDSAEDGGEPNPCEMAAQYDRCEVPQIPGGGACVDGQCLCYADAQCYDPRTPGNKYCSGGRCLTSP